MRRCQPQSQVGRSDDLYNGMLESFQACAVVARDVTQGQREQDFNQWHA